MQTIVGSGYDAKRAAARALDPAATLDPPVTIAEPPGIPGRPDRPALVPHTQLARRSAHTVPGRAALLHAIAQIEFNAIDLALDTVWRFAGMPEAFYRQWIGVAREEALHFGLLREHLQGLGYDYGDFRWRPTRASCPGATCPRPSFAGREPQAL